MPISVFSHEGDIDKPILRTPTMRENKQKKFRQTKDKLRDSQEKTDAAVAQTFPPFLVNQVFPPEVFPSIMLCQT